MKNEHKLFLKIYCNLDKYFDLRIYIFFHKINYLTITTTTTTTAWC